MREEKIHETGCVQSPAKDFRAENMGRPAETRAAFVFLPVV